MSNDQRQAVVRDLRQARWLIEKHHDGRRLDELEDAGTALADEVE